MDNLTHSLFALTLARTRLNKDQTRGTVALVLASNAPDVDIVTTAKGVLSYFMWHRTITHGPIGVLALGVLTAAIVWMFLRWRRQEVGPGLFFRLTSLSIVGTICHVLMDLPTSYGTRLLSPFDWHWFAVDWMPIVDIYLLVALAAGLYFGGKTLSLRSRNVAIVLVLLIANYALRGAMHHRAISLVPRLLGQTLPEYCDNGVHSQWPIDRWPRNPAPIIPEGRRCLVEIAALPTFISPFDWRVVMQMSNGYEMQDINVLSQRFLAPASEPEVLWRLNTRFPNVWTPAAFAAARTSTGRAFLGFSRFPIVRTSRDQSGVTTVRMSDVRFIADRALPAGPGGPGRGRGNQPAPRGFFTATIRFDASGRVIEEHLGD